ncbi:MAG TPA: alpha/beta hydrolase [Candidatus Baltobacteraceae bacterium]|nr:alpha/beta hydrolase [Candidatus Baltobacteraceae bacterium]
MASKPKIRIGTLFFNPGGPGVSGVSTVREAGDELDTLGDGRFDIVSWDPRGTGASTHVRCFTNLSAVAKFWGDLGVPTTASASPAYLRKTIEFAHRCGEVSHALLPNISTAETARDLNHLRELLGEQRVTYLGWSYGSFLGTTYANMFPTRVRAMVLDGIVDPIRNVAGREPVLANGEADADLVFGKFESLCDRAGRSLCALAGDEPAARGITRLIARLRRAPISAPSAPGGSLSYGDFLTALFLKVRSPDQWPQLAKDIRAAESGDGSALEMAALTLRSPSGYEQLEAPIAIACADSPAQNPPQAWPRVTNRLTTISFIYGPLSSWWLWAPCASWPMTSANRYTGPWNASTKTPILLISTRYDPNTPFANGKRLQRLLGNAVLLTHDGYGHVSTADPSACVERAERRYLIDLIVPKRASVCSSDRPPFDPKFGKPAAGNPPTTANVALTEATR